MLCFTVLLFCYCLPLLFSGILVTALPIRFPQNFFNSEFANLRDITPGELNFLHTTDTHGWLGSHLNQENYNGWWGDFISFTEALKRNVIKDNDLLVVDTGDKHDGNGISDATYPNGLNSSTIFNYVDYDLLTLGNHELYVEENTVLEYYETALNPKFEGKYISSNVDFITDSGEKVPFGSKYRYFNTQNRGYKVLSFSFLFDFTRANKRASVTPALEEIEKPWFKDVISKFPRSEVDILVVFGHMPVTDIGDQELVRLHAKLRSHYPNTPIQYFGGHSHIRDFVYFDNKATALQSGRFCETVGFLSVSGLFDESPQYSRAYLDFNLQSFLHHSRSTTIESFRTDLGERANKEITKLRESLNLTTIFGTVPESYYMSNKPLSSSQNIYNLIVNKILPTLQSGTYIEDKTRIIMINTGSIRYDLHEGPFTIDTEYIVSPFMNTWNYLVIPIELAIQIEPYLNGLGPILTLDKAQGSRPQCPFVKDKRLTKGYTTSDDFGCNGDDTKHKSEKEFSVPNVVQSEEWKGSKDAVFVYYSFIENYILQALNSINEAQKINTHFYTKEDTGFYGGKSTKELLRAYIMSLNN